MITKKTFVCLLSLMLGSAATAQNTQHQSQYMLHQALINPAQTVTYNSLNAAVFYKNQWSGFSGAPTTQGFSIGKPFKGYNSAWNAQLFHDKIGVNNSYQIGGGYAYKFQINENIRIGFGLGAYLNMQQSNFAEVHTTVSGDPVYEANTKTIVMPNFRFSTYLYSDQYYVGFAVPNLLKNRVSFSGGETGLTEFDINDMHAFIHAGYKLELSRDLELWPSILVKHVVGTPVQIDFNANARFAEKVGFGLSYRTSQEVVLMANYNIKEELMIGYSYDVSFSDLSIFSSGSHEIMLTYKIRSSANPDKPRVKDGDERPRIEI